MATEENNIEPITHETFLIGFNEQSQVVFFKSYRYKTDKDIAQLDFKWVSENCHHFEFGAATGFLLVHEGVEHEIIIPHP